MNPYQELQQRLNQDTKLWLVTGVAGFIGSHLLHQLLMLEQRVIGLDNFSTGSRANLEQVRTLAGPQRWSRFSLIEGDIRDFATCRAAAHGVDYVLHQAALGSVPRSMANPLDSHSNNVTGFLNILLASHANGVKRVVFASSSAVYGDEPALPKLEEKTGNSLSPYAVTKRINELYANTLARCYGLETMGLRYFNVFGPRQDPNGCYAAVIPKWIAAMIKNERIVINGDGETSRDFCYVANVVQANLLAATAANPLAINQAYNIAVHARTTLNQLFDLLRDQLVPFYPHLKDCQPCYLDFRAGDVRHSEADISKAKRLLGYIPSHTIEQGMAETLEWYRSNVYPTTICVVSELPSNSSDHSEGSFRAPTPFVTVIMPVRNEEKFLSRCIDSLLKNDYPHDHLEILVAEGMSTDRSAEILSSYSQRYPLLKIIQNPGRIVPTGLNRAIRQAAGEIIIRVDAHTVFAPDYISQCVRLLKTTNAANVGGAQCSVGDKYVSQAIAVATTSRFAAGDAKFRYSSEEAWVDTVYLGAWWKRTLLKLGGFNEEWIVNQDYELNHRLRLDGGKILLSPKIKCEYSVRPSLAKLARQYFRYGAWKVKTLKVYPDSLRWRQLMAPLFVASMVLSVAVAPLSWPVAIVVPILYLVANLAASVSCARQKGWRYLPMLPAVFGVVHFAWGVGFWVGTWRFGLPRLTPAVLLRTCLPVISPDAAPARFGK